MKNGIDAGIIKLSEDMGCRAYTLGMSAGMISSTVTYIVTPDLEEPGQYRVYVGTGISLGVGVDLGVAGSLLSSAKVGQIHFTSKPDNNEEIDNFIEDPSIGVSLSAVIGGSVNGNPSSVTGAWEVGVNAGASLSKSEVAYVGNIDENGNMIYEKTID